MSKQETRVNLNNDDAEPSAENEEENKDSTKKYLYETQHFGFTPITLVNGMFNVVCDLYREALKTLCGEFKERFPDISDEQLQESRHQLSEHVDKDICTMFDTLEFYLLNQVFSIPENVVLAEDKCQLQVREHDSDDLERRKNEVKKKIIEIKYANSVLSQHLEDAEALQANLDTVLKKITTEGNISQLTAKSLKDWLSYYTGLLIKEKNVPQ
ncbi:hypothetical protein Btru_049742 [Bulinus truncatus]|nr:hypothetical protein Btru_049742 [Bulinus truncatus]